MQELGYRIGKLDINPHFLKVDEDDPNYNGHRFVAEALGNLVSLYVSDSKSHLFVSMDFGLSEKNLVGGGNFYLNSEDNLVLDGYSKSFWAIPKEAAQIFADLAVPELKRMGFEVKGTKVNPNPKLLGKFWLDRGFDITK